jgi:hypothetical protein
MKPNSKGKVYTLSYVDPEEIIREHYGQKASIDDEQFSYDANLQDHPCSTRRWQQCQRYPFPPTLKVAFINPYAGTWSSRCFGMGAPSPSVV